MEARSHFQQVLKLQRELGMENWAIEALASLVRVQPAEGDAPEVQRAVEEILGQLVTHELAGTDEPLRVYLTWYRALRANGDPKTRDVLETGYRFLQEQAAGLED